MNPLMPPREKKPSVSLGTERRVDQICLRFERELLGGSAPTIESYLARCDREDDRQRLLRELLAIEIEHRQIHGPMPKDREYQTRFPDHESMIDELLNSTKPDAGPAAAGHVLVQSIRASTDKADRYTLSHVHGEGGLGRVWLARDATMKRDVALKEIRPQRASDLEAGKRFLKEARITGQLEHPGIVPVYELCQGEGNESPYYTMRFVHGQTLADAIAESRHRSSGNDSRLHLTRLLTALVSVCNAVDYAHSRGVIHRDLKPENVVLGNYGEVIVLDWGLAKRVPSNESNMSVVDDQSGAESPCPISTQFGAVLGTPCYMAPEQAAGRNDAIDTSTDVYGLGAVLFELLTGGPPHRMKPTDKAVNSTEHGAVSTENEDPPIEDAIDRLLTQIIDGETPRARAIDPRVPAPLDAICARAMARNAKDRYRSAAALAEDIQRWLADEPVTVYRDSSIGKLSRWTRRHRGAAFASFAALAVVAVVAVFAALLVNSARRRAETAAGAEAAAKQEVRRGQLKTLRREAAQHIEHVQTLLFANRFIDPRAKAFEHVNQFLAARDQAIRELDQLPNDRSEFATRERRAWDQAAARMRSEVATWCGTFRIRRHRVAMELSDLRDPIAAAISRDGRHFAALERGGGELRLADLGQQRVDPLNPTPDVRRALASIADGDGAQKAAIRIDFLSGDVLRLTVDEVACQWRLSGDGGASPLPNEVESNDNPASIALTTSQPSDIRRQGRRAYYRDGKVYLALVGGKPQVVWPSGRVPEVAATAARDVEASDVGGAQLRGEVCERLMFGEADMLYVLTSRRLLAYDSASRRLVASLETPRVRLLDVYRTNDGVATVESVTAADQPAFPTRSDALRSGRMQITVWSVVRPLYERSMLNESHQAADSDMGKDGAFIIGQRNGDVQLVRNFQTLWESRLTEQQRLDKPRAWRAVGANGLVVVPRDSNQAQFYDARSGVPRKKAVLVNADMRSSDFADRQFAVLANPMDRENAELEVWSFAEDRSLGELGEFKWSRSELADECHLSFSIDQRFLLAYRGSDSSIEIWRIEPSKTVENAAPSQSPRQQHRLAKHGEIPWSEGMPTFDDSGELVVVAGNRRIADRPWGKVYSLDGGKRCDLELPRLPDIVRFLAVGHQLVGVAERGTPQFGTYCGLVIWDINTGRISSQSRVGRGGLRQMVLSPDKHKLLISIRSQINGQPVDTAVLWDLETNQPSARFGPKRSLRIATDRRQIYLAWTERRMRQACIWKWSDGSESPGRWRDMLAAAHLHGSPWRLWRTDTGLAFQSSQSDRSIDLESTRGRAALGRLSPDGGVIALNGGRPTTDAPPANDGLWDVRGGRRLVEFPRGEKFLRFDVSGKWAASVVSATGAVRIWNVPKGEVVHQPTVALSRQTARYDRDDLMLWPDGSRMAIWSHGRMRIWDLPRDRAKVIAENPGHVVGVTRVAQHMESDVAASGDQSGLVVLWNRTTGAFTSSLAAHTDAVTALSFSADGRLLASASKDGRIALWTSDGKLLWRHRGEWAWNELAFTPIAASATGYGLVAGDDAGHLVLFNEQGTLLELRQLNSTPVRSLAFSPSGKKLAAIDGAGELHLWESPWRGEPARWNVGDDARSLSFVDDDVIAVGGDTVAFWSVTSKQRRWKLAGFASPIRRVQGTDTRMAIIDQRNRIQFFDLEQLNQQLERFGLQTD